MAGRWGLKPVSRRRDDALARMDPLRFEALVAEYYRRIGYDVEHCGTGGSRADFDGGIDLKLRRGREYLLVQCKRENAFQVPHNPVHQLIGTIVTEHASGAIFINTGEYTAHARRKAAECPQLQLIDGDQARSLAGNGSLVGSVIARFRGQHGNDGSHGWCASSGRSVPDSAQKTLVRVPGDGHPFGSRPCLHGHAGQMRSRPAVATQRKGARRDRKRHARAVAFGTDAGSRADGSC